jgi:hypothetical protein
VTATAADLSKKLKRALRNDQGTRFSSAELRLMTDLGVLDIFQCAEAEELKATWQDPTPPTSSGTTGSTSVGMGVPPPYGKSPQARGMSAIEALGQMT